MDLGAGEGFQDDAPKPRQLPDDLPRSLDDRRNAPVIREEVEWDDAWQGQSQFLTTPVPARPLAFNLSLNEPSYEDHLTAHTNSEDSDDRLVRMLHAQARLKQGYMYIEDEGQILSDESLSEDEKRQMLQSMLTMAASNGEATRVKRLLSGPAKDLVDVNVTDAEGNPPLNYASCFGHEEVVSILLDAGASVDKQDGGQWTSLMWAMNNRHTGITKLLLDHGASPEAKSSTGRTALDFLAPNSEISELLHESGYNIGTAGVTDDFYNTGLSQDRFEEEMAENEMKRRMMMESAFNLEVDLGNLGLDEKPESPGELEEEDQEFVWDRCLNDQMFVFQETELGRILDIVITNMTPQRSPSQKPVPANILFLGARYAHYHATPELLNTLLQEAMARVNDVVERHQWDMTILAFWIANATLLLHYLKKDTGLSEATGNFQLHLVELINDIFVLIIRDAERRMDKVLDVAMLDHETIPGFEDITFQKDWNIFRSKPKPKAPEPFEKRFRPPSPKQRAKPSPRNITSLLSSTLFVLDLYDIHSVITAQVISQLLYWLGAEIFNRIMSSKKYLARTKAMQIRMNVSTLEDWARSNNRQPEHYENGSMTSTGEMTADAARKHLAPVVQLLQWLQCFSSLGDNLEALVGTLQQLPGLTPQQLLHSVRNYRAEVGEKGLPKSARNYLLNMERENAGRKSRHKRGASNSHISAQTPAYESAPATPIKNGQQLQAPLSPQLPEDAQQDGEAPDGLLFEASASLPFILPTSTDMIVSYGAGFGGLNRERERKYIPTVPPEFLAKLDVSGNKNNSAVYDSKSWQGYGSS